jgi:serine/threonine protein kinase
MKRFYFLLFFLLLLFYLIFLFSFSSSSDIFAFGVSLYELIAGCKPFKRLILELLLYLYIVSAIQSWQGILKVIKHSLISTELKNIICRMLIKVIF